MDPSEIKLPEVTLPSESFILRNETPTIMLGHGILVGWIYYMISTYCFSQNTRTTEGRSIVIGLVCSLYFVLFGLRFPNKVNPDIF